MKKINIYLYNRSQPVSGGEKKKSYDYSVVMTVDQTDIDMRDHCSAGQKVIFFY